MAGLSCITFTRRVPTLMMRTWGKFLLWVGGVKLHIEGLENADPHRPAIYMVNHTSAIDIPILVAALPVHLRFLFKNSLMWVPILGWSIYAMGMIPVDRSNKLKAAVSLRKAADRIRSGFHVLIFPEGTRSRDGRLLPFKKGGFRLALTENVDIIPVTLRNSTEICGRNSMVAKPGVVEMVIHPRYSTANCTMADRERVVREIRNIIESELPDPVAVRRN